LNIAFILYGHLDLVSGGFIYDRHLIAALRARGIAVEVFGLPWRRGLAALADNLRPWPAELARFDVIVQDELIHPSVFLRNGTLPAPPAPPAPIIALVHNVAGGGPLRRAAEARYLRAVAGVIAVSHDTLREVEALCGRAARATRAIVAPPGRDHLAPPAWLDDAFVSRRAAEAGPLRLLMVATVMPHKGLHRLLAALAGVPGWTLEVAGSLTAAPRYVRAVRARVAAAGLGDRVRLHGELPAEGLRDCYRRAQLLVLPSDSESYGLACLEALGHGLPVLVTDRGGVRELVTAGEGELLDPTDGPAWARAVAALAGDRPRLAALSRAARARFARHGTWSETAAVVDDFLRALAGPGGEPPLAREHHEGGRHQQRRRDVQ
jgi:glycosyltransferase involved in cell wall biosynthesis